MESDTGTNSEDDCNSVGWLGTNWIFFCGDDRNHDGPHWEEGHTQALGKWRFEWEIGSNEDEIGVPSVHGNVAMAPPAPPRRGLGSRLRELVRI